MNSDRSFHGLLTILVGTLMVIAGRTKTAHSAPLAPNDASISGGLSVWLRDANTNFDGTTWNDVSGNNNHAAAAGLMPVGETYVAPSLSALVESNGAFSGLNVSGVRFDGQTDDMLRVTGLNGGTPMGDATTIIVYASPQGNNTQRPVGLGTIQTTSGVLDDRPVVFNPSDDGTIRYDWGQSGPGTLSRPFDQLFVRASTLASTASPGEGIANDYFDGLSNQLDKTTLPDGGGFPVEDALYIGDVRAGATPLFSSTNENDLFVAEVITYDTALTQQQISGIGEWLGMNIAVTAFDEFPQLTIDRLTGSMSLQNNTSTEIDIVGYSMTSATGSLDQSNWTTITDNYDDAAGLGNGSVDADDAWTVLTAAGVTTDLSEEQFGGTGPQDGGTLGIGSTVDFGAGNGSTTFGPWIQFPTEDVQMQLTLVGGSTVIVPVAFEGNGDVPWSEGDLDFNGSLTASDWTIYKAGFDEDLTDLSPAQAYRMGDLDGDLDNDALDFGIFKTLYNAENGAGAFGAMIATVPEPRAILLLAMACLFTIAKLRRGAPNGIRLWTVLVLTAAGLSLGTNRQADAADINWGTPTAIGTEIGNSADVNNSFGEVVEAFTAITVSSPLQDNVTVNGVEFVATTKLLPGDLAGATDFSVRTNDGDAEYDDLVSSLSYGGGGDLFTITLGDGDGDTSISNPGLLASGSNYQIQLWFADDRAAQDDRVMQFGDGNGNTVLLNDQFAIGTFTADGATQDISLDAQGFGNAHITAYLILGNLDLPSVSINTDTGAVTLKNTTPKPFDMDLYRLSGPVGSLDPAGWNSLESVQSNQGQDLSEFPRGDNNGNGWEELGTPSTDSLSEAFLTGSSVLGATDSISLGNAFDTGGSGEGAVTFEARPAGGVVFSLDIEYVTGSELLCDLDADLDCDPTDIVLLYATSPTQTDINVWLSQASDPSNPYKTNSGDTYVLGDVNLDGDVNSIDLGQLLNNFNSTAGLGWAEGNLNADTDVNSVDLGLLLNNFNFTSASAAAVPEPATAALVLLGMVGAIGWKRRRR